MPEWTLKCLNCNRIFATVKFKRNPTLFFTILFGRTDRKYPKAVSKGFVRNASNPVYTKDFN
jgi:hypothetical protein